MKVLGQNHISLSRRNLEALLHMLDNRDKTRPALYSGNALVEAQEDDEHYDDRQPGVMSWETNG